MTASAEAKAVLPAENPKSPIAYALRCELFEGLNRYVENLDDSRLRDAQRPVLHDLLAFIARHDKGYVSLPTGAGKTVLFTELLTTNDQKALIVVPTTQLVAQTIDELAKAGITDVRDVSPFHPESFDARISVCTYMSLVRHARSRNGAYMIDPSKYGIVILDEAHHAMAEGASEALVGFEHAFQIGFTATPDYSEERQLQKLLPALIHQMTLPEAAQLGLVAPYSNYVLFTNADMSRVRLNQLGEYDSQQLEAAINTPDRNTQLAKFIAGTMQGQKVIVSSGSIDHADDLAGMLLQNGVRATSIHGKLPKTEQARILEAFRAGSIDVLCNNKILGEGFDDPTVTVAINASPTRSSVRQQQRSGRVLRTDPARPDKHAIVIDCIDNGYTAAPVLFSDRRIGMVPQFIGDGRLPEYVRELTNRMRDYNLDVYLETDPAVISGLATHGPNQHTSTRTRAVERRGTLNRSLDQALLPTDWREDARCAEVGLDVFYPEKGGSVSAAMLVCASCVVMDSCLADAMVKENQGRYGVWGGLSTNQRRLIGRMFAQEVVGSKIREVIDGYRAANFARASRIYRTAGITLGPIVAGDDWAEGEDDIPEDVYGASPAIA